MPTARLALVVALASAVMAVSMPVGLVLDALVVTAALIDLGRAAPPRRMEVSRTVAPAIALGHEAALGWRVVNPTASQARLVVADTVAPSLHAGVRQFVVRVPAGGAGSAHTTVRPARRGRFPLGPIVVRSFGPWGLAARQATHHDGADPPVRVLPPFRSRAEAQARLDKARVLEVGLRSAAARGGGTEFDQLRDYRHDDEFRRIDWAATARTNRAVVRTYRAERNQTVTCLLDNGRAMAGNVGGVPRIEHAMDAVMMLAVVATRLGDRVALAAYDRTVRVEVPASAARSQLARVTEAMYELEPELVESDLRGAVLRTVGRSTRRQCVVILTELRAGLVDDVIVPTLAALGHHIVIVAAVRDPLVAGWATAPMGDDDLDAAVAYRRAAAVAVLADRARAAARLRDAGAIVIDAPPGRLAAQVADAYLEAKASGRL
jgi:uncharacterized protein (DUF58 family)